MKHIWSWSALACLASAAQQAFNVHNDLLAFPQYEVVYSDSFLSAADAHNRLQQSKEQKLASDDRRVSTRHQGDHNDYDNDDTTSNEPDTYERMILNSKPYLCAIPYVAPGAESGNATAKETAEERKNELQRATNHGSELLNGMSDKCIYYQAGWWVYAFCYNDGVKQFHRLPPGGPVGLWPPVEDPKVGSFSLGRYNKQADNKAKLVEGDSAQKPLSADLANSPVPSGLSIQTRGEANFLVQKLGDGTICDLTGRPRTVTIQFHCNAAKPDYIHMIQETASCVYTMVIHTPRLCDDVAFLPPQVNKPNIIACQEVVESSAERDWRATLSAKMQDTFVGKATTKSELLAAPVHIGSIELGGKQLVGDEPSRMIKASNIVKPAKQQNRSEKNKLLAVLAKSDGKSTNIMSLREVRKFGVKADQDEIYDLVDQMEEWAGENVPWQLELIEMDGGFYFRGTRNGDDNEERVGEAEVAEPRDSRKAKKDDRGSQEEYKDS